MLQRLRTSSRGDEQLDPHEMWLWHGTSRANPRRVCMGQDGIDCRRVRTHGRLWVGVRVCGVNMTRDACVMWCDVVLWCSLAQAIDKWAHTRLLVVLCLCDRAACSMARACTSATVPPTAMMATCTCAAPTPTTPATRESRRHLDDRRFGSSFWPVSCVAV